MKTLLTLADLPAILLPSPRKAIWESVFLYLTIWFFTGIFFLPKESRDYCGPVGSALVFLLVTGLAFSMDRDMRKRRERTARQLAEGDFVLVKNRVSFKNKDIPGDETASSVSYILYFHAAGGLRRSLQVDKRLFDSVTLGEPCYLVLCDGMTKGGLPRKELGAGRRPAAKADGRSGGGRPGGMDGGRSGAGNQGRLLREGLQGKMAPGAFDVTPAEDTENAASERGQSPARRLRDSVRNAVNNSCGRHSCRGSRWPAG